MSRTCNPNLIKKENRFFRGEIVGFTRPRARVGIFDQKKFPPPLHHIILRRRKSAPARPPPLSPVGVPGTTRKSDENGRRRCSAMRYPRDPQPLDRCARCSLFSGRRAERTRVPRRAAPPRISHYGLRGRRRRGGGGGLGRGGRASGARARNGGSSRCRRGGGRAGRIKVAGRWDVFDLGSGGRRGWVRCSLVFISDRKRRDPPPRVPSRSGPETYAVGQLDSSRAIRTEFRALSAARVPSVVNPMRMRMSNGRGLSDTPLGPGEFDGKGRWAIAPSDPAAVGLGPEERSVVAYTAGRTSFRTKSVNFFKKKKLPRKRSLASGTRSHPGFSTRKCYCDTVNDSESE